MSLDLSHYTDDEIEAMLLVDWEALGADTAEIRRAERRSEEWRDETERLRQMLKDAGLI